MGLFTPFIYKSKSGQKFWLHMKERGKAKLYYFSKDPVGALNDLPKGFEIVENKTTGMPFLKKKISDGLLTRLFKPKPKTEEKTGNQEIKKE
jgi:hypothetical protein